MKNFYSTITAHSSKITLQIFSFLLAFGCFQTAWAEGTKQVAPNSTDVTMLLTCHPTYSTFAGYNATANNRLYIHISNPATEQVYMGFSQQASVGSGTDGNLITTSYYFRVKDASGNIVYGPQLVNNTNANANTWALANAGPAPIVGASGYTPFTYTPAVGAAAGDYYIEFSDSPTANGTTAGIAIKFWDITVSPRTTPSALNGRVWSKNWAFRTPSVSRPASVMPPSNKWNHH